MEMILFRYRRLENIRCLQKSGLQLPKVGFPSERKTLKYWVITEDSDTTTLN